MIHGRNRAKLLCMQSLKARKRPAPVRGVPGRAFCYMVREHLKKEFALVFGRLLFGQVFAHIQRAGKQDNRALDEELEVLVDRKHVKGHKDNAQDKHAHYDAADLTGAAHKRDAANNAGRNGVALVVEAGVLGNRA